MSHPSQRPATHGLAKILEDEDVTTFEDVREALRTQREDDDEEDEK